MLPNLCAFASLREISSLACVLSLVERTSGNMNAPLGYALLRDRRVPVRAKCVALAVGLAVMGIIQLLQVPFESVLAFVLPGVGAAGDVAVDGVEAVVLPVLVATLLMPYLAPQNVVQEVRAQHASRV
jgi:hypothetical protein